MHLSFSLAMKITVVSGLVAGRVVIFTANFDPSTVADAMTVDVLCSMTGPNLSTQKALPNQL